MYVSIIDKVRARLRKEPIANTYEGAIRWYRDQIRKLSGFGGDPHFSRGTNLRQHLLKDPNRLRSNFYPGMMYLFAYSAKWKKTLPYWDKFPLVFFIGPAGDGTWMGINFHYLNYKQRLFLFHELITLADKHPDDARARVHLSYQMLKGMARFKSFKPCFHKYLPEQIVSKLVKIDAPDWEIALFLPVENFTKKGKTYVWQQSSEIINGNRTGPSNDGLPKGTKKTKKTPTSVVPAVQNTVSTNGLPKKKEI